VLHHQATSRSVRRRLLLGVAAASFWTAAAIFSGPSFSVGLQVFSDPTRYIAGAIFGTHACLALFQWKQQVPPSPSSLWRAPGYYISLIVRGCIGSIGCMLSPVVDTSDADNPKDQKNTIALYSFGSMGLLILALLPQLVPFPTATIPTLLGKRMSRVASGWTFLASVVAYSLMKAEAAGKLNDKDCDAVHDILGRGLGVGAAVHVVLVALKLIGVDGGGLLLPGRGLQENYPSLVGASRAATLLMIATYSVLPLATFGKDTDNRGGNQ